MTRKLVVAVTLVAGLFLLACQPHEVAVFKTLSPEHQQNVLNTLSSRAPASSSDCYGALGHFSGDHGMARKVIHRESRNNPAAQNRSSSAAGCFQLLSMHAHRFDAVGCSWAQRYNAVCNVKAADHLYRAAGWSPWRLTTY
jgi:hypothetical protein